MDETPSRRIERNVRPINRNYKKDWSNRKPFYMVKIKEGIDAGKYLLIVNERRLVTEKPITDLIANLEDQLHTLKQQLALSPE